MRVLLDTCVVSELQRPDRNSGLVSALSAIPPENMFISVLTIGEIEKGVTLLPPGEKRQKLEVWALRLLRQYEGRLLPIELNEAEIWGKMLARMQTRGRTPPSTDSLIAATAIANGLTVITRNVADFGDTGCAVFNPWA